MNLSLSCLVPYWEIFISVFITLVTTYIAAKLAIKIIDNVLIFLFGDKQYLRYSFFKYLVVGLIYFVGIFAAISMIPVLKNAAYSVLASSGIIAIIGGFASKEALSQVVSGFLIEIFKPFVIGDYIKVVGQVEGKVKEITLRHTILEDSEGQRTFIPNTTISSSIIINTSKKD